MTEDYIPLKVLVMYRRDRRLASHHPLPWKTGSAPASAPQGKERFLILAAIVLGVALVFIYL